MAETRRIHVVGTVPAAGPAEAMELMAQRLGPYLTTMPDGETDRPNWVIEFVERRAEHPDLITLRRSQMSNPIPLRPLLHPPRYIARQGRTIAAETLVLPYAAAATQAWPILRDIVTRYDRPGLRLQVGIPGPLDVAAFSWVRPLKHYDAEFYAVLREIRTIFSLTRGSVVYQLELPLETVAVARAPRLLRHKVADNMARRACELIGQAPKDSSWIIHLCYGNKNDEPLTSPPDVRPLVELGNALYAHWPQERVFEALHLPFGDKFQPASPEMDFYAPMKDLKLPGTVHVSAGLVRVGASIDRHRFALDSAERMGGRGAVRGVDAMRVGAPAGSCTRHDGSSHGVAAGMSGADGVDESVTA